MAKEVYILEIKMSPEKVQKLTDSLRCTQEYKITQNYTLADFIVTELKSPSRIMRMVKKSMCPIVHISWLLESIPFEKLLDPLDYQINVSEARKLAIIDLSTRIPVRTLPRQYTWDQIAKKRWNRTSLERNNNTLVLKSTGLQARSQFTRSYGNKAKATNKHLINKVTALDNLKQEIMSTVNTSKNTNPPDNEDHSTVSAKKEEPIITSVPLIIETTDSTFKMSSKIKSSIKSDKQAESFTRKDRISKGKQADLNLTSRVPIPDNILNHGNHSSIHQENEKVVSSNEPIGVLNDSSFSITDTKKSCKVNSLPDSYSITTDKYNNPIEQTHPFGSSFHSLTTDSVNFSCSSISSIEDFDFTKYSLSALLSL